ncbi:hypothetical protein KP005_11960 [Geomonas nitrogeniifigens]|uniref:Uncharacterized protein n=1 Tax=Geomonas diazotrophica TaxID=2843197 RepID=A0ABX8JCJ6_9BACT|nr:hypothetical protein [Geomonas nitrogeniifigens]QWV96095.1 hypothetical protein KP005_11960 [Geomonas nitrogeniifigens]
MTLRHRDIWQQFCLAQQIRNTGVPLFETSEEGRVSTTTIGTENCRHVLLRSKEMEALIVRETDKLVSDWRSGSKEYDGLIYLMYTARREEEIIPLYIGKTETIGKGDGNLSVNVFNLQRDRSKFARWGDNYAYHIGDLSAVSLAGHSLSKVTSKYKRWADQLFESYPAQNPKLKTPVFFWAKAWGSHETGIWREFGPTRLTFLEYLLIGVASSAYPETLLNIEGHNRNCSAK